MIQQYSYSFTDMDTIYTIFQIIVWTNFYSISTKYILICVNAADSGMEMKGNGNGVTVLSIRLVPKQIN